MILATIRAQWLAQLYLSLRTKSQTQCETVFAEISNVMLPMLLFYVYVTTESITVVNKDYHLLTAKFCTDINCLVYKTYNEQHNVDFACFYYINTTAIYGTVCPVIRVGYSSVRYSK